MSEQTESSESSSLPYMTRPAFPVAIALVVGILLHRLLPPCPGEMLALAGGCLIAAGGTIRHSRSFSTLAMLAIIGLGCCAGDLAGSYFPADHIALFTTDQPRLVCVRVGLDESPHLSGSERGQNAIPRVDALATALSIHTDAGWTPISGRLQLSFPQPSDTLAAGQTLELTGILTRPLPATNPGQFDWQKYDRTQRLLADLYVSHASGVRIIVGAGPWAIARLRGKLRGAVTAGFPGYRVVDARLLAALFLGDRGKELRDVTEAFRKTGAMYLLASNGLRIAVLAAGIYLMCRLLRVSPRKSVASATILVIFAAFFTLPTPQALRPAMLSAAIGLCILSQRRTDTVQLFSLVAICILLVNPLDLYDAGFQLSFATVLGLMLFAGPLARWLGQWDDPHQRVANTIRPGSNWGLLRMQLWRKVRVTLAASLIAWLVATPLVAAHFEQFNPWAIPVGLLLWPLVFLAMITAYAKVVFSLLLPGLAANWAQIALFPAEWLRWSVLTLAKLPGCDVAVSSPPPLVIVGYYILLCLPAIRSWPRVGAWLDKLRGERWASTVGRWSIRACVPTAAAALVFITISTRPTAESGTLRLTLLDVGAGQTAVIELPDGRAICIDCGSSTLSDDLNQCLAPFLRHEGRSRLDAIYLSHGDYDHISAAAGAVEQYDVPHVYISPNFRVHARESYTAQSLLNDLERLGRPAGDLWVGQQMDLGSGARLEVLFPPAVSTFNSNNSALVLRLTYAGRSILFPADIQVPAEEELLKHPGELASDVLIAPHHGSCEITTAPFISAVHPRWTLASSFSRLTAKQRQFDHLSQAHPLYRTSRCGALILTIDPAGKMNLSGFRRLTEESQAGRN